MDSGLKKIEIGAKTIFVEMADTPEKRRIGLMNRKSLKKDHGMLFVFEEEGVYPFWMKNTLIPLRIIWISKEGKVVDVQEAVPCEEAPCRTYNPAGVAKFVLEVGVGDLVDLEIGAVVEFY